MRCPSAKRVSNARDDFPDPDRPVTTTSLLRGIATLKFLRLFTRALLIIINCLGSRSSSKVLELEGILIRKSQGTDIFMAQNGQTKTPPFGMVKSKGKMDLVICQSLVRSWDPYSLFHPRPRHPLRSYHHLRNHRRPQIHPYRLSQPFQIRGLLV